jgi:hypothetical protein
MPSQQYTYLNSTLVKEVARLGGSVHGLVPRFVEERMRVHFGGARAVAAKRRGAAGAKAAPRAIAAARPGNGSGAAQTPHRRGRAGRRRS